MNTTTVRQGFDAAVKKLGITLELPRWWSHALEELGIKKNEAKTATLDQDPD